MNEIAFAKSLQALSPPCLYIKAKALKPFLDISNACGKLSCIAPTYEKAPPAFIIANFPPGFPLKKNNPVSFFEISNSFSLFVYISKKILFPFLISEIKYCI